MNNVDEWRTVKSAPKDREIFVYGTAKGGHPENEVKMTEGIYIAQWDHIDEAFCIKGGGWLGPFIEPLYWRDMYDLMPILDGRYEEYEAMGI